MANIERKTSAEFALEGDEKRTILIDEVESSVREVEYIDAWRADADMMRLEIVYLNGDRREVYLKDQSSA